MVNEELKPLVILLVRLREVCLDFIIGECVTKVSDPTLMLCAFKVKLIVKD